MIIARVGLLVVSLLLVSGKGATAQDSTCDAGLVGNAGPHGYTLRGDRCEGIYVQQVGGTLLALASLTESFQDYSLGSGAPLIVEWTLAALGDQGVRLRARGIRHGLFYRMDTVRPARAESYQWPLEVLAAQHVSRRDIGVLAWTRHSLGGVARDVYLPLRIGQDSAPARAATYELVLFPAVVLREVYVTVTKVDSTGHPARIVQQGTALDYGHYPAERPVRVKLPNLGEAGIYQVDVGAELASGGSTAVSYFIYHARGADSH